MALLSALAHGNSPGGVEIAIAAIDMISELPDERARVCFDLIRGALDEVAGRILEHQMQYSDYEYKSDFARRYFGAGLEKGIKKGLKEGREAGIEAMHEVFLQIAEQRFGLPRGRVRRSIRACSDLEQLTTLVTQVGAATNRGAVERLLARLEAKQPGRSRDHRRTGRAKTAKTARATRATRKRGAR